MRIPSSLAPNVWARTRRFFGGVFGVALLVFGAARCADLTAPAEVGDVTINFSDPAVDTLTITVGDTIAPAFTVSIGAIPQPRARYVYSVAPGSTRLRVIGNGSAIVVLDRGIDTIFATVVGAAVGGATNGAQLVATLYVNAIPADIKVEFATGFGPTPANVAAINATRTLNATAVSSQNVALSGVDVDWVSTAPGIVAVTSVQAVADTSQAIVTALNNGSAEILAIFEGVDTVRTAITVQQTFDKFRITSTKSTGSEILFKSLTDTVTARIIPQDINRNDFRVGSATPPAASTISFALTSSASGRVQVNAATGLLTSEANTSTTDPVKLVVNVTPAGGTPQPKSDSVVVKVEQEAVSLQIVGVRVDTIPSLGGFKDKTANALDSLGKGLPPELILWTSSNTPVASVSTQGSGVRVQGVSVGTTTLSAASVRGNRTDQITMVVRNDPNSVALSPDTLRIRSINDTVTFPVPVVSNSALQPLTNCIAAPGTPGCVGLTFHSLDSTIVEPLANGAMWGKKVGVTRVFVTTPAPGSKVDTSRVEVTNAPATIDITPTSATLTSIGDQIVNVPITLRNSRNVDLPRAAAGWRSGNESVARVTADSAKTIIATGIGDTYIYAYSPIDSLGVKDSVHVVVTNNTSSLTTSPSTAQTLTAIGATINFTATARNAAGNVIPGAPISWSVASGGTFLSIDAATGVATALANGAAVVRATSSGVTQDIPVTVAQAYSPTRSTIIPTTASLVANGSSNTTVTIQLKDANDNNLTFGGATVVPSVSPAGIATLGAVTDAGNGRYTFTLTSGTTIGTATVSATVNAVAVSNNGSVALTVGAAAKYMVTSTNSTPTAGTPVTIRAQLADANNNPVNTAGNVVQFTSTNGGSFTPANGQATTDLTGVATITFNTNPSVSTHSITGTTGLLSGISAPITSVAGTATKYIVTPAAATTAPVATGVTINAQLSDANNNPVAQPGQVVTWTKSDPNGSLSNGGSTTTNAAGLATVTLTTHTAAGTSTMVRATTGSVSDTSATITTVAGSATAITVTQAPQGNPSSGIFFSPQPSIQLRDGQGNPVAQANVTVTASITSGSGTISGATAQTDATGLASFGSMAISGPTGAKTITFAVSGVGTVNANVTLGSGSATQMALNAGNGQTATANTNVGTAPSVIVRDANNNPVQGVAVTFAIGSGGGSFVAPGGVNPVPTDVNGVASLTSWTLGTGAGTSNNTLTATAAGLTGSPVTFMASATAGAANNLLALSATSQSATIGTAVAPPSVRVRDQFNNPVAGFSVTFTLTANGGSGGSISPATPASVVSDANGVASLSTWTLGTTAGSNNNTVTAAGVGPGITFNASGNSGAAQNMIATVPAATSQTATVNTTVATAPSVTVRDASNNPVTGIVVTFAITAGGGSFVAPLGGSTVTTDASGVAALSSWTIGTTAGTNNNTLTATVGGLTGSPVTFTASGTPAAASGATTTITAAPTSVAADGSSTSTITVQARDAFGNNRTTSGGAVTLTASPGGALAVTDNGNGTYTATLPGSGTAGVVTINGTINPGGGPVAITDDATVTRTDATAPQITGPSGGAGAGSSSTSIAENVTTVHTFAANETVTWSLTGGADQARFSIVAGTGALSFQAAPNFEAPTDADFNNTYVVVVTATDGSSNVSSQTVTVTVTDAAEVVAFTIDAVADANVAENSAYTSVTPSLSGATPIGAVTYSLTGADAASFTVNPSNGVVSMVARNFENPVDANTNNVYELTLVATDSDGNTDSEDWTVTVTDVNEVVAFTIDAISNTAVMEGAPYTSVTPALSGGTPIGTVTWSISGGADAADFTINPSTGVVSMIARDFENPEDANFDNVYELTISATDADLNTDSEDWTVSVTNIGIAINPIANTSVNENTAYTSVTPALTGDTPAGTVTYTLGGADAARFTINPSTGVVSMVARDFEAPADLNADNIYEVTITATDAEAQQDSEVWTVTVLNLNDAPPTITSSATPSVAENSANPVHTMTATDPDGGGPTTWSITGGVDQGDFTINPTTGALSFAATPNFEAPADADANNTYIVEITATDGGSNASMQVVTVTVTDVAPTVVGSTAFSVAENTAGTIQTYTSADPASVTWSISGTDAAAFTINPTTGALSFTPPANFDAPTDNGANNVYNLTVTSNDGTSSANQAIAVTVTDVDDVAPTITSSATPSVAENSANPVHTMTATDPDGPGPTTWSITGGVDQGDFTINPTTGALSFAATPNFEAPADNDGNNTYVVEITATDAGSNTSMQVVTVTVTDVAPTVVGSAAFSVAENTAGTIQTYTSADPASVTWSISGTDAGLFTINPTTGALSFTAPPDFEAPADNGADNVYDLTVTSNDGTSTANQAIAVTVTDADDVAPTITSSATPSVAENTANPVHTMTATDPDGPGPTTWSITGGVDQGDFTINPTTGQLSFAATPNFEAPADDDGNNTYIVEITATDAGSNTSMQTVTLTVTDVAPTVVGSAAFSVAENTAGTIQTYTSADAGSVTWSISGTDAGLFTINPTTGALSFTAPPNFEAPADAGADNVYDLTVTSNDGTSPANQAIAVTVTDVAPTVVGSTAFSVAENTAGTIQTYTSADAGSVTWSISGTDAAAFTINPTTGALSFTPPADFDAPTDNGANNVYDLTVTSNDGTSAANQAIAVTVTDVDDVAPTITSSATPSVAENSANPVHTMTATDPDGPGPTTWSITGGADQGDFTLNPTTGELSFAATPDFEAPADDDGNNTYVVEVTATDAGSNTSMQVVTVTVTDVAPTVVGSAAFSVAENTAGTIQTYTSADAPSVTWSISGTDAGLFTINPTTGALSFTAPPDFETPLDAGADNVYDLTVTSNDGTSTADLMIAVTVTNVADPTEDDLTSVASASDYSADTMAARRSIYVWDRTRSSSLAA